MDGEGCVRMTSSQLGNHSQLGLLGLSFGATLAGLSFPYKKLYAIVDTIHLYMNYTPLYGFREAGMGALDVHVRPP